MKRNLKRSLFLAMIYLIFCLKGASQPICFSFIDPFQACNYEYLNREFVFIGRVISIEERLNNSPNIPIRIVVEVETLVKGKLERQIEIFLDQFCDMRSVTLNQEYIFTADWETKGNLTRLFSKKWSYEIKDYSKQEKTEFINRIRSVIKNIKQPRIVGKVIQHFGKKDINFSIRHDSVNNRLGYDPKYSKPLAKIVIVAKHKTGKEFKTKTNVHGEYEFKDLPNGDYEIFIDLPKEYNVLSYGDIINLSKERRYYLKIDDGICSKNVNFNTQILGSLNVRILNITKKWAFQSDVYLIRIDPKSGRRDIFESELYQPSGISISDKGSETITDFSIEGIPIGKYILFIHPSDYGLVYYYPGVKDREKAEVIEVKSGKTNKFVFRLP